MKALAGSSTAISRPESSANSAASPPDRLTLAGPSRRPDPRTHAYRPDLADVRIAGQVFAPHYARAEACRCIDPAVMLRAAPNADSRAVSQILHGETFEMLDRAGDWAWGLCAQDSYVGYAPIAAFGIAATPTHRVIAREALLFAEPDIKSTSVAQWSLGAAFAAEVKDGFLQTRDGYVHQRHAAPIEQDQSDPVDVAYRLLGAPYLWGGRGAGGIDCSGLVQLALSFAGIAAPRDSDQQRVLGDEIPEGVSLRRGDLVFFPGHVGLMYSAEDMIHANAHWMAVTVEPLADVVARLATTHAQPILARRRIAA